MTKKIILCLVAVLLIVSVTIVGTVAYLNSKASIKNVFTIGKVEISFDETGAESGVNSYSYQPGDAISKDAVVTVKANSEDSYVFCQLAGSTNFASMFTYTIADLDSTVANDKWTALDGYTNVYVLKYTKNASDKEYHVFTGDKVYASSSIPSGASEESVTIYTGAIQAANIGAAANTDMQNAVAAWKALTSNTGTLAAN